MLRPAPCLLVLVLALLPVLGVLPVVAEVVGGQVGDARDNVTTWLPRHLEPQHYRVRVQPILDEGNFTAPGELEFTFWARKATDRVVLNVRDLRIDEDSVTVHEEGPAGQWTPVPVIDHEYDTALETYAVVLGASLRAGAAHKYRLRVKYIAAVGDNLRGLYRVSYKDANNNERWMAMTQVHPTNARAMFPCMDEPQYKARFTLSVARRAGDVCIANMPLEATEAIGGGWELDHFQTSVPMSTYLIALAVFNFDKIESSGEQLRDAPSEVRFRVWARPSEIERGVYASRIGPPLLRYFSHVFNISFPLPKQDMVATPKLMFGAMENWGLIFFREGSLLVDEGDTGSRHHVASTVAHELAHQWFGNLVTMRWWNDVWLNEGFATYMSQLGVSHVEPQWRSEGLFVLENMQRVMQKDATPSSHPVSREVYNVSDIDHIFDDISYKKGSSVVRMMSEFLGAAAFQKGLNAYLRRHADSNAAQDDLWASLTDASQDADGARVTRAKAARRRTGLPPGASVKTIMDTWTLRTGFPVVDVVRDYCVGTASVRQERFVVGVMHGPPRGGQDAQDGGGLAAGRCCWGVPLWLKTARSQDGRPDEVLHWLEVGNTTLAGLPGRGHWILVNGQRAGYYRVNYDADNWSLLSLDLASLTDLERAGLVDDALALAGAGRLDYGVGLGLLQRLARDSASLAWVAALNWLGKLTHLVHQPDGTDPFSRWARDLAGDLLRASESVRSSTDPVDHAFVTGVRRWACGLGVRGCLGQARHAVEHGETPAGSMRSSDSDLCQTSMTREEWNVELSQLNSRHSLDMQALAACIQSHTGALRMLEFFFLNSTEGQSAVPLLKNLASNPYSFNAVMEFLKDNWADLQERYGTFLNNEIVKATAPYAKTYQHMVQVRKMQETLNLHILPQVMEEGSHNMWWLQNQADKLFKAAANLHK